MKNNSFKKVILTSILAFIISLFIFIGAIFAWFSLVSGEKSTPSNVIGEETDDKGIISETIQAPRKTNFLLTGVDQTELLSDVIMVGCFDSKTCDITLISIPRDTYVEMSDELRAEMKADGIYLPSQLKINAIHSYAGKEKGNYYLQKYLEEMMGITIDYYAEVNTAAFRDIVDAVGGVDMEIRPEGYHYYDPTQNLVIDVPGGMQHLDGEMAEGVVRYRHDYVQGDIDRIEVQQEFIKEFFVQVLDKATNIENSLAVLKTCISYTNTNFKVSDLPQYITYLPSLNEDSITLVTAPGNAQMIGGASYYLIDDVEMTQLVNSVFYGSGLPKVDETLLEKKIQILNGSDVDMLATQKEEELEMSGYNVRSIGDWTGEYVPNTIIYTKEGIDATALSEFFTDPVYEVSEEMTGNYDIVVVLGESEQ